MAHLKSQVAGADDPLYRRDLLRLAADALGAGTLESPHGIASRHNPACGDRVQVSLTLQNGKIATLAHDTRACILTQASAALLAAQAPGLDGPALAALAASVRAMLRQEAATPAGYGVFEGVVDHAGRHICVLLPLDAALEALKQAEKG